RQQIAALILAEILQDRVLILEIGNGGANTRGNRHFSETHGEATIGQIMAGGGNAGADQLADEIASPLFMRQIDMGRRAVAAAEQVAQIDRLTQMRAPAWWRADQQDHLIFGGKA